MPTHVIKLIDQARAGDRQAILDLVAHLDPFVRQIARGAHLDDLR